MFRKESLRLVWQRKIKRTISGFDGVTVDHLELNLGDYTIKKWSSALFLSFNACVGPRVILSLFFRMWDNFVVPHYRIIMF